MSTRCINTSVLMRFVLAQAPLFIVHAAGLAEPPSDKPIVRLSGTAEVKVRLAIDGYMVLSNDKSIVVVGTTDLTDIPDLRKAPAGGVSINMTTRAIDNFTNSHRARISGVGLSRRSSRIVTTSTSEDPVVRIWNLVDHRPAGSIDLSTAKIHLEFGVACFHRDDRVAVTTDDKISIFDLNGEKKRIDIDTFEMPQSPVVSPDDRYIAWETPKSRIVVWDNKATKVAFSTLMPLAGAENRQWTISAKAFTKSSKEIIVAMTSNTDEVPSGVPESKVLSENRGLFCFNITKGEIKPLGIGQQISTLGFALHPSERWIVTVGPSWPDEAARKNGKHSVGELRVFDFKSKSLLHHVQFDDFYPSMAAFTHDGKTLIAIDSRGRIRWWGFSVGGE